MNALQQNQYNRLKGMVEARGGKVISEIYVSNNKKMDIQCEHNHLWNTTPDSIFSKRWCRYCSGDEIHIDGQTESFKFCKECKQDLPKSKFGTGKKIPSCCTSCRSKKNKKLNYPRKIGKKRCPACKLELSTEHFSSNKTTKDGLTGTCKICKQNMNKRYLSTFNSHMNYIFSAIINRAERKKLSVEITKDDIISLYYKQNGICVLSGKRMLFEHNKNETNQSIVNPWNISVDRLDSSKGYSIDNIQLICTIINMTKGKLSNLKLYQYASRIIVHNFNIINDNIVDFFELEYINKINDVSMKTLAQKRHCRLEGYIHEIYRSIIQNLRNRSKPIKIDITEQDILFLYHKQNGRCNISGIQMTHIRDQSEGFGLKYDFNISVDRISSSGHYTLNNIHLVCMRVNLLKSDLLMDNFLSICYDIYNHNSKNT